MESLRNPRASWLAAASAPVRIGQGRLAKVYDIDKQQSNRMGYQTLSTIILNVWQAVTYYIASGHAEEFTGQDKETAVLRSLRKEIEQVYPNLEIIGPDMQASFGRWRIDLVRSRGVDRVAMKGKFKIISDGAVPGNRKDAFFDLFKLESYVSSDEYSKGLFLWLTNQPSYLKQARGDSLDFSTHQGRIYEPRTQLNARRARNRSRPLPLTLSKRYVFNWQEVIPGTKWHRLELEVG